MTLLSLIGHQAKVTNCIRSRFCKYKPGCGVSHNSNHRAAELVTRAIPQLSQETEHFCRSVNKSCEDCPVWAAAANKLTRLEETQHFCGWGQKKVAKIVQCGEPDRTKAAGIGSGGLFSWAIVFVIASRSNGRKNVASVRGSDARLR